MRCRVCTVAEGRVYSVGDLARRCSADRGALVQAFRCMREALEEYRRLFLRVSRRLFGFPVGLDAPTPKVGGGRVFTGLWSGVFHYASGGECLLLVVTPRVRNYHGMVSAVREALGYPDFHALLRAAPAASAGCTLLPALARLLAEVDYLLAREPRRLSQRVPSGAGGEVEVSPDPLAGVGLVVYERCHRANAELLSAVAYSVRSASLALKRVRGLLEEVREEVEGAHPGLAKLLREYVKRAEEALKAVLRDEFVAAALSADPAELGDPGRYGYLVWAAKRLERGLEYQPVGVERARFLLYPSTKVYELYVYAHAVRSLSRRLGKKPTHLGALALRVGPAKLYFNRCPRRLSRIVAPVASGRAPRPDALVRVGGSVVVLEAKYRRLDSERPRLLGLADAERLAAYLLDACRSTKLRAVVAVLSKPPQELLETMTKRLRPLNGKMIRVDFAEVDPDGRAEDLADYLLPRDLGSAP